MNITTLPGSAAVALLLSPFLAGSAAADPRDTSQWTILLGGGLRYAPEFEGSDEMDTEPLPFISIGYGRFSIGPDSIGARVYDSDRLNFGVSLGYGGERKPEDIDSGYLDGFEDIDGSALLGARLGYDFGPAEAYIGIERFLGGSDGTSATLGVEAERQATERLSFSAGVSATFSDSNYMESYFGVTGAQSLVTGYAPYEAGSGLRRFDLTLAANYAAGENWFLRGELGVGRLAGDAADSPIVRDKTNYSAMLFVGYRF